MCGYLLLVDHTIYTKDLAKRALQVSSHAHYGIRTAYHVKTVEALNKPWSSFAGDGFIAASYRYSWTKLLNEWFKVELQRQVTTDNIDITVLSGHPGLIGTENNYISWPWYLRFILHLFARSPEVGGNSALIGTTSPLVKQQPEKYRGAYLDESGAPIAASAVALNKERASELWKLTSEIISKSGSS